MTKIKPTLADKIAKSIKRQEIKPVAKRVFLIRRFIIWLLLTLSVFVSAITLSMVLFRSSQLRRLPYDQLGLPSSDQLLDFVPIIFIITLVIGIAVAIKEFSQTEKGYKFEKIKVGFSAIGIVLLLAILLSYTGINRLVHRTLVDQARLVPTIDEIRDRRFNRPSKGVIAGIVEGGTLTDKAGKELDLVRGDSINEVQFNSISDLEQPVVLFGKPSVNGFIVCSLNPRQKPLETSFERKPSPPRTSICEAAIEPDIIKTN